MYNQNILIYYPQGISYTMLIHGITFYHAFKLRNLSPLFLTCDGILDGCEPKRWDKNICSNCQKTGEYVLNRMHVPFQKISNYIDDVKINSIGNWISSLRDEELFDAEYNSYPISYWCHSSFFWWCGIVKPPFINKEEYAILRHLLYSGAILIEAFKNIFHTCKPDIFIQSNGRQSMTRIPLEIAKLNDITVYCYELGLGPDTIALVKDTFITDVTPFQKFYGDHKDIPLKSHEFLMAYRWFKDRREQINRTYNIFSGAVTSKSTEEIRKELGCSLHKPVVSVFSSNQIEMEESQVNEAYGQVFSDQCEWISYILQYFIAHSEYEVIIRLHPNHLSIDYHDNRTVEAIKNLFHRNIPSHIKLIMPDNKFSSYDLIKISRYGITFGSTIGIEIAALGLPVLNCSKLHHAQSGALIVLEARETFQEELDRFLGKNISDEYKRYAFRYINFFNYIRSIPFTPVYTFTNDVFDGYYTAPSYKNTSELIEGNDAYFDYLIDIILSKKNYFIVRYNDISPAIEDELLAKSYEELDMLLFGMKNDFLFKKLSPAKQLHFICPVDEFYPQLKKQPYSRQAYFAAHFDLANKLFLQKKLLSISEYEEALYYKPESAEGWYNFILSLIIFGRFDDALNILGHIPQMFLINLRAEFMRLYELLKTSTTSPEALIIMDEQVKSYLNSSVLSDKEKSEAELKYRAVINREVYLLYPEFLAHYDVRIPDVSIFMPVYNGEKYLAETLDSILSQTFHDYELIIADDGSTDKTADIARTYEEKDKRIKLLTLLHGGEVKTRNEVIKHTHPGSKYLLNHDCDDISLPDKLARQVSYLEEHPEISIVGTFATYFDDYGNDRGSPQIEWEPARIRETFGDVNSMINSAALIRRKVFDKIGGYREEFRSVDDYDFFARALLAGFELANIPEVLHKIRLHKSSIGSTKSELQEKLAKQIKSDYKSQVHSKKLPVLLCDSKIEGKSLKLHLGCGDIKIPGFINIDIDKSLPAVDVVDNIRELNRFNKNCASIIYACHVLEHFPSSEILSILRRWHDILEPGGELRISVPDIDRIVDIYKKNMQHFLTPPHTPWIGLIYGGQSDEYDFHKTGFNFTYLKYLLYEAGFTEIEEYPHSPHWLGIEDASLANQPFNEYISLNIKGMKPQYSLAKKHLYKATDALSILHTVEFYFPHIGGAEIVVQQISERLVRRGHRVTVATGKLEDRNFTELNGVEIREFSVDGSSGNGIKGMDIHNYQEFILDYPADIMMNYAAQQWATDIAFNVLPMIKDKRVNIIAPCGYSALLDSHTIRWPQFTDYFTNVIPKILPLYDAAIYHSSTYKDYEYAKNYGFKNGVIIPNGIDEDEFTVKPSVDFREKYNIKTKYLGLCVANFYEGKGQDRVIECVKKMKRKDFTMVFIGKEGDLLDKLKALTSGLKVLFLVNIPREDTVAAYHSADIFIFGSHIEASPLVIIEAKASKTPFVSTDCGNVREWKGGIVCNADDMSANVNKILNDKSLRKGLEEEGYKEWKEYLTWDIVVDKYEELYLRLYHEKVKGVKTSLTVWTDELKLIQKKIEEDYSDLSLYIKAASILLKDNCINDAMKYIEDGMELDSDNKELVEIYEKMVKGL